jgi:O-antigen/teichoic acid export membrane protein
VASESKAHNAASVVTALTAAMRSAVDRLRTSALGVRFARGAFWSLVGAIASRSVTLASSFIVARLLGTIGFGQFSAVQSTVGAILVLAGLGLGMTATKYVAELHELDPNRASRMIALCLTVGLFAGGFIAGVLAIFAPTIAGRVLAAQELATALRISALVVVFGTLVSTQTGVLAGFEAFDTLARIGLLVAPLGLVAVAVGTYRGGVTGAISGLAITQAANWFLNRRAIRRRSRVRIRTFLWPSSDERRVLYQYSAPALLTSLVIAFSNWIAIAALVNSAGGYHEMGLFGAANQWLIALLVLPTIIGQVVFPHATRILKEGYASSSRLLRHATMVSAAVSLPIVLIGCALSPFLMRAYGSGFQGATLTLITVLITAGFMAIQTPAVHIIAASGRVWWLLATYIAWSAVFVGGSFAAVAWGSLGLAVIRLVAYIIHSVAIFAVARRVLRSNEPPVGERLVDPLI